MSAYWNRFYVSSKVKDPEAEAQVAAIILGLTELGYENTLDWTTLTVKKPYYEHKEENAPIAKAMIKAVKESGIFIIRYAEFMVGSLYETGIAIGDATTALGNPVLGKYAKKLFVVGNDLENKSIFHVLEPFVFVHSTEALLDALGPAKPIILDYPAPH